MTPQEKMKKVKAELEKAYSMLGETLANFVESLTGNTEQNNQEENMEHEVKSLSDSEIEQVLECCASNDVNACNRCPFWGQCRKGENPIVYIHDFINRLKAEKENMLDIALRAEADNYKLKAEIDRLNIELKAMRGAANSYKAETEKLNAENKSLITDLTSAKAEIDRLQKTLQVTLDNSLAREELFNHIKAEAVKECMKRLKDVAEYDDICEEYSLHPSDIDNIVKELLGKS